MIKKKKLMLDITKLCYEWINLIYFKLTKIISLIFLSLNDVFKKIKLNYILIKLWVNL
jgi:hypothetical protein